MINAGTRSTTLDYSSTRTRRARKPVDLVDTPRRIMTGKSTLSALVRTLRANVWH